MTQQLVSLIEIQNRRKIGRKLRPYSNRISQLERHKADIIKLRQQGASFGDIQYYLRAISTPRLSVARSTIKRFLDKQITL